MLVDSPNIGLLENGDSPPLPWSGLEAKLAVEDLCKTESTAEAEQETVVPDATDDDWKFPLDIRRSLCMSTSGGVEIRHRFLTGCVGEIHERYDLETTVIGRGAYGHVVRASCKSTGATRACKSVIKARVRSRSALQNEITMTGTMDHPNIVRLYGTFQDSKNLYLVMEYLDGGELFDFLAKNGPLIEREVAVCGEQLLRAILYMHERKMIHRDVKPENLIWKTQDPIEQNTLKLVDFGQARRFNEGEVLTTMAGSAMYVAPEVTNQCYGKVSEYWSCGVIMYLLLAGEPPFTGMDDRVIIRKIKSGKYVLHGRKWENVSELCKSILRRFLVVDETQRLTAGEALQDDLFKKDLVVVPAAVLGSEQAKNLRAFSLSSKFKKITLTAMATQLAENELVKLTAIFNALDKTKSGILNLDTIREALAAFPEVLSSEDLERTVRELDTSKDHEVSYTEFLAATMDQQLHVNEELCWQAFKVFDIDGTGSISRESYLHLLLDGTPESLESIAGDDKHDEEFKEMDRNGDGQVTFEEFLAWMKRGSGREHRVAGSRCCAIQ